MDTDFIACRRTRKCSRIKSSAGRSPGTHLRTQGRRSWAWAGAFRKSDKNIGCDWTQVGIKLRDLFENTRWWMEYGTFTSDEIAARFHRDLVWINPFANGNGRHARMMADVLVSRMGQPALSWGGGNLVNADEARARYLAALRAADQGNYQLLLAFVRS